MRGKRSETVEQLEAVRRAVPVIALGLAIMALIVAVKATGTERAAEGLDTTKPTAAVTASVGADLLATEPVEIGPWEFAGMYRAAEDPAEKQQIGEALEAQGYFSAAVPLPWEYQDYMRTYCHLYGWDPAFAAYLAKKRAEGKHYNVALSHAAKKLVRLIFALEKSKQPYCPAA